MRELASGGRLAMVAAVCACAASMARADGPAPPDFAPDAGTGWLAPEDEFIPPPSGPGPILSDAAHPYLSFYKYPRNPHPSYRVADLSNPILQPWTRDALRRANERAVSGVDVALPKERCWPVGVPGFSILPATPIYFLQTPKEVVMIWTQDHQVRHVWLNRKSFRPPEAVLVRRIDRPLRGRHAGGRYHRNRHQNFVDNYFTPHTEQLHVIERYRMVEDGKTLQVELKVEDPGAFTTPWTALQRYRRVNQGAMPETVCAENNDDHFNHGIGPIPQARTPDF